VSMLSVIVWLIVRWLFNAFDFCACFSFCFCLSFVLFLLREERVARCEHGLERLINRKMGVICVF
jgi:hypothetical protein